MFGARTGTPLGGSRTVDGDLRGVRSCVRNSGCVVCSGANIQVPGARLSSRSTGSCLGLGGINVDSAITAMLDANKCVACARDASGRVLARQLLAVTEDDRLACFSVYPKSTGAPLKRAFRAFDESLAAALTTPLYRDPSTANIPLLLGHDWWDDGAVTT